MLVVIGKIENSNVHRILVDNGSASNSLYLNKYNKMGLALEFLKPVATSFYGFTGDSIMP